MLWLTVHSVTAVPALAYSALHPPTVELADVRQPLAALRDTTDTFINRNRDSGMYCRRRSAARLSNSSFGDCSSND
jgi:hypothetical protein